CTAWPCSLRPTWQQHPYHGRRRWWPGGTEPAGRPPEPGVAPARSVQPMRQQIRLFLIVEGASFVAAALTHFGALVRGYEHGVAEATGFDVISAADHVWGSQYTGGVVASQVEAYTSLGFIAARTRRVRLLVLATAASYRHAGLLAKIVTTLDVLSGGRAMLGIGAGDYAEEARGLGLPFPAFGGRFELLEETVQACLRM